MDYTIEQRVPRVGALYEDDLRKLVDGEICGLRISKYCEESLAGTLGKWAIDHPALESYELFRHDTGERIRYGVDRVGVSLNTTFGHPAGSDPFVRYFASALTSIRRLREACRPHPCPIDQLRVDVDDVWPPGANLATFHGKKATVGIVRLMNAAESPILARQPHCDGVPAHLPVQHQFSANIYLRMPPSGGELEIWDMPSFSIDALLSESGLSGGGTRNLRAELPLPLVIRPEVGELIMINTRRPHAVRSFDSGTRITVQCFFGVTREQKIVFWS